jgi:hypothetical protein
MYHTCVPGTTWCGLKNKLTPVMSTHAIDRAYARSVTMRDIVDSIACPDIVEEEHGVRMEAGQIRAFRITRGRFRCWANMDRQWRLVVKSAVGDRG